MKSGGMTSIQPCTISWMPTDYLLTKFEGKMYTLLFTTSDTHTDWRYSKYAELTYILQ